MEINGLRIQNINTITDKRGSFTRFYDSQDFLTENLDINQINLSVSLKKGTLRGMHFQVSGPPENKYINIISGSIFLVVVDLRSHENTFLNVSQRLFSSSEKKALYIPSGCATGWLSLTEDTKLLYTMSARYEECVFGGFRYNDPRFSINWPSRPTVISDKDLSWPDLDIKY
jgi:dTDP-4-dehydrorhamnose 3,5-epimerase